MIKVFFSIFLFAIFLNWCINLQILAHIESNPKQKNIAVFLSFLSATILGLIIYGLF